MMRARSADFQRLGASNITNGAIGTAAVTLITAVANVNGLWIRSVSARVSANGLSLYAGTTAPSNWLAVTSTQIMVWENGSDPIVRLPLFIPPGLAVYAIASAASRFIALTYDLL